MDPESEQTLVSRLRDGDPGAFDELHAQFNARLFSFLARLSRSRETAQDLVDEMWFRVVANARNLRPESRLGPWLFTIARNLYWSHCRSRMLESSHEGALIGLWPAGSPQPSPFEETAANETDRRIEAALAALPVAHREVLVLVGVEGLQPVEAAAICGITPEALRQRLHRARAMLLQRMEELPAIRTARVREVLS